MGLDQKKARLLMLAVSAVTLLAIFAPSLIAPQSMNELGSPYLPPGPGHVLGTNDIGQDLLSELVFGARASLLVGLLSALIATAAGALAGALAGYFRGRTDALLMGLTDMFLAIPGLPLIIILAAFLGPGMGNIVFVISLLSWAPTARIIRSKVLNLREQEFILNARCLGAGHMYLIFRHILPNTGDLILAKAILAAAAGMMAEAGLSFLGLGDPVSKSWGGMIHDAFSCGALTNGAYWWYLPPIFCLSLFVLAFSVISNAFLQANQSPAMSAGNYYGRNPSNAKEAACNASPAPALLEFKNHSVSFPQRGGEIVQAIQGLDLTVQANEKIAVLGLSGSGKSLLLLSIIGVSLPKGNYSGRVLACGEDVVGKTQEELCRLRRNFAAYTPQGTGNGLNPVMKIERQIMECIPGENDKNGQAVVELLAMAGLDDPERTAPNYPHRLSGGMKEKVLAAMALASPAKLILADEPTKALDPDSCKAVTKAFASLKDRAMIAVTHDLDFARTIATRVLVLHQGRIVEDAPASQFFENALHPFSLALLRAVAMEGWKPEGVDKASGMEAQMQEACSFIRECPFAWEKCRNRPPLFFQGDQKIRCWRYAA
ncbi:oligopeptide/dipeptide ABC transporter ATP-binding protein [Desulfatibacillum aliphaticivorans]|uniref:oligopeptide/dipeptide ABC transporter ATP-binding protein n=1 Tax=Desulfatibacillum aliphaticivorans TaxID=218208 RepID=UPI00041B5C7D|nr:dipeptide/oligopeptide/nickel ABC transporter permease/ATP-binding protein [Desulfatibacillum aliphaticivorans]